MKPSTVLLINGEKVGVIGAELKNTPELVSAGNTAGLTFLPEGQRIKEESERLRKQGVDIQIVVIHQGTNTGQNADRRSSPPSRGRARSSRSPTSSRARPSTRCSSATRTGSRTWCYNGMPIMEGINAGTSYSVAQLILRKNKDIAWVGAATRVAKNIGVARGPTSRRSWTTRTRRPPSCATR